MISGTGKHEKEAKQFVMTDSVAFDRTSDIEYKTANPKQELLDMLQERLPGAAASATSPHDPRFDRLQTLQGPPFSLMPEVSFLEVLGAGPEQRLHHRAQRRLFQQRPDLQ